VKYDSKTITIIAASLMAALYLAGCTGGAETVGDSSGSGGGSGGGSGTNHAPTISGSPAAAVNVNQTWTVSPSASDSDGDSLTFTVQNPPGWASFNPATGVLTGTPGAGDVGMYPDITIRVSDGALSDDLGPFSVEVTQVALGSATVELALPSQYNDGSSLSGHMTAINIYYGVSRGNYPNKIEIANVGTTTYVVDNLVPDTYYFVATITDDQGMESNWSSMASVTVQSP